MNGVREWRFTAGMAIAVSLCVLAVSCSNDESGTDTTAATTTSPSIETLAARLLTPAEIGTALGGGDVWRVEPIKEMEGLAGYTRKRCDDLAVNPAILQRLAADVGIDGSRAGGNASLAEFLLVDEAAQLAADLTALRGAEQACLSRTSTGPGMAGATREITLPVLGDQQWAEEAICRGWGPESHGYSAVVRVDGTAIVLGICEQAATTGGELLISEKEFVELVKSAVAKLIN